MVKKLKKTFKGKKLFTKAQAKKNGGVFTMVFVAEAGGYRFIKS